MTERLGIKIRTCIFSPSPKEKSYAPKNRRFSLFFCFDFRSVIGSDWPNLIPCYLPIKDYVEINDLNSCGNFRSILHSRSEKKSDKLRVTICLPMLEENQLHFRSMRRCHKEQTCMHRRGAT